MAYHVLKYTNLHYLQRKNELLVSIIRDNWDYIDSQLTKSFNGIKTEVKEVKLKSR